MCRNCRDGTNQRGNVVIFTKLMFIVTRPTCIFFYRKSWKFIQSRYHSRQCGYIQAATEHDFLLINDGLSDGSAQVIITIITITIIILTIITTWVDNNYIAHKKNHVGLSNTSWAQKRERRQCHAPQRFLHHQCVKPMVVKNVEKKMTRANSKGILQRTSLIFGRSGDMKIHAFLSARTTVFIVSEGRVISE